MLSTLKLLALSALLLPAVSSLAQIEDSTSSTTPVARVYVTRPTHLDAFNVSSSGKLTAVLGSPFSNIALSHLSINKKYLFGASDDNKDIYSYAIESNGAVKQVGEIDTQDYHHNALICPTVGPTQIDRAGETLYNFQPNCGGFSYVQSYRIGDDGQLQYISQDQASLNMQLSGPVLLANDDYAYLGGGSLYFNADETVFRRESNGLLTHIDPTVTMPALPDSTEVWHTFPVMASDPANHIATVIEPVDGLSNEEEGPIVLISFSTDSEGDLNTTNKYKSATTTTLHGAMSISPTGKLLALGGGTSDKGFEVYHFNGANLITKFTGLFHSSENFLEFGWDKSNHLYALSSDGLHIYTATSTSIKEESGSPISIPEASSLIVQSLN